MNSRRRAKFEEPDPAAAIAEEDHKEFLLSALRGASLRAKAIDVDLTTIGIALSKGLIGTDSALCWIRDAGLLWIVGAVPEQVGRVAQQNASPTSEEQTDMTGGRFELRTGEDQ